MSNSEAKSVIQDHIERKCQLFAIEPDTVSGHIENERSVTNDYRGRALFELLQNAIDRAEHSIWINFNSNTHSVIVANDGKPFSEIKRPGEPRSDLAALCSLHTSNKKAGESIGNKGVGFKSVWEFCNSVQVRTRTNVGDKGWGIRLRQPFIKEPLATWCDQSSVQIIRDALDNPNIETKHQGRAPSFYFPEYVEAPLWSEASAVTAIELEEIGAEDYERLSSSILPRLLNSALVFSGDIRSEDTQLELIVSVDDDPAVHIPLHADPEDWIRIDIDTAPYLDKLKAFKDILGFELKTKPRLTLGFPHNLDKDLITEGRIHSYLPTKELTGSPLHIQGDFYLSESRKHVEFGEDNKYNDLLLEIAIEALVESIEKNIQGIAALPYVLSLLSGNGRPGYYLDKHLDHKEGKLSKLLATICLEQKQRRLSFYDDVYDLIGKYTPSKTEHYYDDHKNRTLKPYFQSFEHSDLDIVPVDFKDVGDEENDPVVENSRSLDISESNNTSLFCRKGKGADDEVKVVDVPGVIVTKWRFPERYSVADNLKLFSAWSDYEAEGVLRAVKRAQELTKNNHERLDLLSTAANTFSPKETCFVTRWRFLQKRVHPARRLLIPVEAETGWAEVCRCYLSDKYPQLKKCLDPHVVFPVDEVRCREALGESYKSILKFWGVWDVVPLISDKGITNFKSALISYPEGGLALKLLAESYATWEQIPNLHALEEVLAKLKIDPWLQVSSGSSQAVSPEFVYLGMPNGNVAGYHLINSGHLADSELHLLSKLSVTQLDSTRSLNKLVQSVELIVENCDHQRQIKGSLLSAYRQLIKRINKILPDSGGDPDEGLLNRLPLLYENVTTHDRGIATDERPIWYAPGNQRVSRSKINDQNMRWWLAGPDVATLAGSLKKVQILRSKTSVVLEGKPSLDDRLRTHLEREYLPLFMALACYGDVYGVVEVEESSVQRRWQGLSAFIVDKANLCENFGSEGQAVKEVITNLSDSYVLWEPLLPNSTKDLKLYVIPGFEFDNIEFKSRVCLWFAEEVFRRRELYPHFEGLINENVSLSDFDVSNAVLKDSLSVVKEWLPEVKLNRIIDSLNAKYELGLTVKNWREYERYARLNTTYEEVRDSLPNELHPYLEPLNPVDRNSDLLLNFVDEHVKNFAVVSKYANFTNDDWLQKFHDDPRCGSFSFHANGWVLEILGLSENEFQQLAGKIDYDLARLNEDRSSLRLSSSKPDNVCVSFRVGDVLSEGTVKTKRKLLASIDDDERLNSLQDNSKAGKNVEEKLALLCARDEIYCLSYEEKEHFFQLLKNEYERIDLLGAISLDRVFKGILENLLEMSADDLSEHQWKSLIHIGGIADGAGYDVISYSQKAEKLLLIEVKSCRSKELSIMFSENERRQSLMFLSDEFHTENLSLDWRMYFVTEDGQSDVTTAFSQVVHEHDEQYVGCNKFVPVNWKILGIQVNP